AGLRSATPLPYTTLFRSQGGHLELAAQRCSGNGDRHLRQQVIAIAPEQGMGPHLHIHVQIAGTAALGAGSALPRQPNAIAAVNARRYADFYGSGFMHLATAAAVAARILDGLAGAAAGRAGLLHGKEALLHAHLALSATGGTDAQATIF